MKKIVFILVIIVLGISSIIAQEVKKDEEVKIETSAVCKMCKERIEHDLSFEKGVKAVDLDLETKVVTVKYKPAKTNPDKIRLAISKIGYDADEVEAERKAYAKLPACCKKDAPPH